MMQPDTPLPRADLILIGASARAASASAAQAGLSVIAIDLFGDSDTRELVEKWFSAADWLDHLRKTNDLPVDVPKSVPVLQVGDFDGCEELIDSMTSPDDDSPVSHFHGREHLERLHRLSKSCGLSVPETRFTAPDRAPGWLQKRFHSSGGLGVSWSSTRSNVALSNLSGDHYWQRWAPGKRFGATFIGNRNDSRLIGVCRSYIKRLPGRPFVYKGSAGPVKLADAVVDQLKTFGRRCSREFGIRGLFNVDLLVANETSVLLEINPRWSSSMELHDRWLQHRFDGRRVSLIGDAYRLATQSCDLASLGSVKAVQDIDTSKSSWFDKRVVYGHSSGRVQVAALRKVASEGFEIADIPSNDELIPSHAPIATLISTCGRGEINGKDWISLRRSRIQMIRKCVIQAED